MYSLGSCQVKAGEDPGEKSCFWYLKPSTTGSETNIQRKEGDKQIDLYIREVNLGVEAHRKMQRVLLVYLLSLKKCYLIGVFM